MDRKEPPEGRARDGGLRLGEMERDALLGHGIALFLKEKFMDTSDAFSVHICDKCGLIAKRHKTQSSKQYETDTDTYECPGCDNTTRISKVMMPYAFKLLVQELMSIKIVPRIKAGNMS